MSGGGKSDWLLRHAQFLSERFENHRTLMVRKDYPRLKMSLLDRSFELYSLADGWKWKERELRWKFEPTGAIIQMGHFETQDDVKRYLSAEFDCIAIDEATELSEAEYKFLFFRNRTPDRRRRHGVRPHMVLGSNPGSLWLKTYFVDGATPDTVREVPLEDGGSVTRAFVPARYGDNPFLDPADYVNRLNSLPTDQMRRAYRDGRWDAFEGQYFTEWNPDLHVCAPFPVPDWWRRWRAVDWGHANPYGCLWIALDSDNRAWVYREDYHAGLTAYTQGRRMIDMSVDDAGGQEIIRATVVDPSIFNRSTGPKGRGDSTASEYRRAGMKNLKRGNNARVDGWNRLHEWLSIRDDGLPGLVFMETCPNIIRTLPALIHDKNNSEDVDTDGEDHLPDALRYWCMSRPRRSTPPKQSPSNIIAKIVRRQAESKSRRPDHPILGSYD